MGIGIAVLACRLGRRGQRGPGPRECPTLAASGVWDVGRRAINALIYDYAMRMAVVFLISTSTILARSGLAPRLLALSGYLIAAVLLIFVSTITVTELLF